MVKSQVETVLGAVDAEDLGITLPHEHVTMDVSYHTTLPTTDEERERYYAPITMENLSWLRHNIYKSKVNVSIYNEQEAVITDLKAFKKVGGATVVENTVIGINRDIAKMVNISKSSGVHLVCGTGYFVDPTVPGEVKSASVEQLAEIMISEINDGIKDSKVRPGIIGEVGTSLPLTDFEKRSVRAAAEAQIQTQTPVMLHPDENPDAPFEIVRFCQEAGGDVKRCVMAHLDYVFPKDEQVIEFADMGTYLEYNFFGSEISYLVPRMSDLQRIEKVIKLIEHGYEDKLLL